jgi:very-short-patch-repair endonuclease
MKRRNIVAGARVTAEKVQRARDLRRNMTPAERVLWQRLRANRLDGFHFRRQQVIDGFIVDFYCHEAGLVVEVDGPVHVVQQEADAERESVLRGRGLTVLRFSNREVMNRIQTVIQTIRQTLRAVSPPQFGEGLGEG